MNIEIANRLVTLRKQNSFSQEALAEKLGISRQAVSKWERAEASPDTDNLILLSRIYGISMDELLRTEDEIPVSYIEESGSGREEREMQTPDMQFAQTQIPDMQTSDIQPPDKAFAEEEGDYVHIGLDGIHCRDKDNEVHIGWKGIHVTGKDEDEVHLDSNGIYVNGKRYDSHLFWEWAGSEFPFTLLVIVAFIVIGVLTGAWHPAWVIFFTIPLFHSCVEAFRRKDMGRFAFPVLVMLVYLLLGIFKGLWHPGWLLFLAVPVYYAVIGYIRTRKEKKEETYPEDTGSL